jgi:hypothetical protein
VRIQKLPVGWSRASGCPSTPAALISFDFLIFSRKSIWWFRAENYHPRFFPKSIDANIIGRSGIDDSGSAVLPGLGVNCGAGVFQRLFRTAIPPLVLLDRAVAETAKLNTEFRVYRCGLPAVRVAARVVVHPVVKPVALLLDGLLSLAALLTVLVIDGGWLS